MLETDYKRWISFSGTSEGEIAAMKRQVDGFEYQPRISLALTVSDADEVWIKSSVDSVLGQIYPHLELCICENGSERPHVPEVLEDYATAEERIKVKRLTEKRSRAEAYNAAFSIATEEFVALLGEGDELAPEGLFKVVELLQHARADMIYTDEDHIDVSGTRSNPVFKPYWAPDLLLSTPYIGRLCVMRKDVFDELEGFRADFEGAEEHDLALRFSERTGRIHHLPDVLYHRRRLPGRSDSGDERSRISARATEDALVRRGADAAVEPGLAEGSFRIVRRLRGRPKVSVIVSAPEGMTEVSLVGELKQKTSYPIHQVIVATVGREEHSSADRVSHPFPTRALNLAAGKAEGEHLVFIDARAQITDPEWLSEMLSQVQRREVGAVGCKTMNPAGGLRHGGSLVEMNRLTGYPEDPDIEAGDLLPLVDHAFNFTAAFAECMMVRRALFERVGGFDDDNLPTAFYDLDLSFRLQELGLLNVYTPHASVTCRGLRPVPGKGEIQYMWVRWWEKVVRSLYYQRSPLHSEHRSLERETLSMLSP